MLTNVSKMLVKVHLSCLHSHYAGLAQKLDDILTKSNYRKHRSWNFYWRKAKNRIKVYLDFKELAKAELSYLNTISK